ncbi:MAG: hypothetical protein II852_12900 [Bacteroidales bacterium]|jgi:hypothetical protein|nr:hypothetical protein [Bacteroidales bacterium]
MSKLNWTGVVSKGILKLRLSFDSDVSIPDRMRIMESYAEHLSNSDVSIIESHHFSDGSQMRAVINNERNK